MRHLSFLACLLLTAVCAVLPRAHADNVFHFLSEPGDPVGQGQERTITTAGGFAFQVTGDSANISCQFNGTDDDGNTESYSVTLAAPTGSAFTTGDYPATGSVPLADRAGLVFVANGADGGLVTGQFQILEITYDAEGQVATLAVDFVQHAENTVPGTFGEIRFNSSLPYTFPAGRVELGTNRYRVLSPAGGIIINAVRLGGSTGALTVNYATAAGTDLAGRDYTATSGTLTWDDGDTADKSLTVPVLNSGNPFQDDGTFLVNITGPAVGAQRQAVVTIVNDSSSVTFAHFVSPLGEFIGQGRERTFSVVTGFVFGVFGALGTDNSGASFVFNNRATVTDPDDAENFELDLAPPTGGSFGVGNYPNAVRYPFQDSTHPGLDFSGDGRGSNTLTGNFQVLETDFDDADNVRRFAANFAQYSDGATTPLVGQVRYRSTAPLPPAPGTPSFSVDAYVVAENAGRALISVNRTNGSVGVLTVNYATSDGTALAGINYTPASGTLTWADGDGTPKTFAVPVRGDGRATAGGLSVKLQLTGRTLGAIPQATLTVANVDARSTGLARFSTADFLANSSGGAATITVNRAGGGVGPLTVNYATSDGTAMAGANYTPVSGTLVWTDGDGTPKTFQVPLLNPLSGLASQSVVLTLTGALLGEPSRATLTIVNNNLPSSGAATLSAAAYGASTLDNAATITVLRTGGTFGPLTVNYATADGTAAAGLDYAATQGTLNWADGDGSPKSFAVPILNSHATSGVRSLLIQLSGNNLGATKQAVLAISAATGAGGKPLVSVAASTPVVPEEGGGKAVFVVSRTGDTTGPLTVAYKVKGTAKAGVDYRPLSGTVTIPAGAAKVKVKLKLIDHDSAADGTLVTKLLPLPSADGSYSVGGAAKVKILTHD